MQFTHIANPVSVQARKITSVSRINNGVDTSLLLDGGDAYLAGPEMTARYRPVDGDYLVIQEDGYHYINPKEVFERKYREIGAEMATDHPVKTVFRSRANEDDLRARAMDFASRHSLGGPEFVVKAAEAYYDFLKGAA